MVEGMQNGEGSSAAFFIRGSLHTCLVVVVVVDTVDRHNPYHSLGNFLYGVDYHLVRYKFREQSEALFLGRWACAWLLTLQ